MCLKLRCCLSVFRCSGSTWGKQRGSVQCYHLTWRIPWFWPATSRSGVSQLCKRLLFCNFYQILLSIIGCSVRSVFSVLGVKYDSNACPQFLLSSTIFIVSEAHLIAQLPSLHRLFNNRKMKTLNHQIAALIYKQWWQRPTWAIVANGSLYTT